MTLPVEIVALSPLGIKPAIASRLRISSNREGRGSAEPGIFRMVFGSAGASPSRLHTCAQLELQSRLTDNIFTVFDISSSAPPAVPRPAFLPSRRPLLPRLSTPWRRQHDFSRSASGPASRRGSMTHQLSHPVHRSRRVKLRPATLSSSIAFSDGQTVESVPCRLPPRPRACCISSQIGGLRANVCDSAPAQSPGLIATSATHEIAIRFLQLKSEALQLTDRSHRCLLGMGGPCSKLDTTSSLRLNASPTLPNSAA
jgi:hypothetical protein